MGLKFNLVVFLVIIFFAFSCNDDDKFIEPDDDLPVVLPETETLGFYVCCEGLFNMNNGLLVYYDMNNQQLHKDYFQTQNQRGIGDTPNDLKIYGSKMYAIINASNVIEVMDAATAKSIKQIPVLNETGVGRQPRYIAFHEDKAYVCNFDGTLIRIDTTSLAVEAWTECGKNPDGICIANGNIYVSNSGGLFPGYDNTVSVIGITDFVEKKKITVATNPYKIAADSEGDVYVISRGNYTTVSYLFQRIDSRTNELVQTFDDINALNFDIHNDVAYLYSYDFGGGGSWIKTFDCKTEQIVKESFISDGTPINTPYGINVDPATGDVYITDAYNFTIQGDMLCFDKDGNFKFKLSGIGLNPNNTVFLTATKN